MTMQFTWDPTKAASNLRKHGVSFDDPHHSARESREIIVGHSTGGRLLLVSFTERSGVIRLISARRATRHERKDYVQATRF